MIPETALSGGRNDLAAFVVERTAGGLRLTALQER
jgi:hypothetical protein